MVGYLAPYLERKLEAETPVFFGAIMKKNTIKVSHLLLSQFPTPYEYHKKFVRDWRTRLFLESWKNPYVFFTLTYDEENLPLLQLPDKDAIQKFFKRFRRRLEYRNIKQDFRYYLVSEYGDDYGRLHYHGLLFGIPFSHEIFKCFLESWPFGRVDYTAGSPKRINYVTKYLHKRFEDKKRYLSLKSNGLGACFLSPEFIQRQRQRKTNWFWFDGRRRYLPRYLMEKVFSKDERQDIYSKSRKQQFARLNKQAKRYAVGTFQVDYDGYSVLCDTDYQHIIGYLAYQRTLDVDRMSNEMNNLNKHGT